MENYIDRGEFCGNMLINGINESVLQRIIQNHDKSPVWDNHN